MASNQLMLAKPSFWSDARAPETWLHALVRLAAAAEEPGFAGFDGPRAVWGHHLRRTVSRRSVPGLFGWQRGEPNRLLGTGLLAFDSELKRWMFTAEAAALATATQETSASQVLESLATHVLRFSPWLRLLLIRLTQKDWALCEWRSLRDGDSQLAAEKHLAFGRFAEPEEWFEGVERRCLAGWGDKVPAPRPWGLELERSSQSRARDAFSWAALKGPLYLLDSLGWLSPEGELGIPTPVCKTACLELEETWAESPADCLRRLAVEEADVRGLVPVDSLMRKLFDTQQPNRPQPSGPDWDRWVDDLLGEALRNGALELLVAEPGQPRHGRGLLGNRQHQLVRWAVHPEFDAYFQRACDALGVQNKDAEGQHDPRQTEGAERIEVTNETPTADPMFGSATGHTK